MSKPPPRAIPSFSLHQVVDAVSDYAIFMVDRDGKVASWNRGARNTKGYEAAEIIGRHISVFYPEEDRAAGKVDRILDAVRRDGRFEDEGWRVRKDGTRFWANVVITSLCDERGDHVGFIKITRDLTSRHATEQALRESEERFHHLVDAVTDYAIFMLDEEGHVTTWNEGARRSKGYEASEIVGQSVAVFYTPEDRAAQKPAKILDHVRREGRFDEEGWRVRKDGTRFWAEAVITRLLGNDGQPMGFAKVSRDLTERRAAAEALRRAEERYLMLVDSVADHAMYLLDPEGRVTTWNAAAERMKGYRATEIVGRSFAVFFTEEDTRDGKWQHELETARVHGRFEEEGWRVRKDGTRFWANVILTALRDQKGTIIGFGKITRDLTLKREAADIERALILEQAKRAAAEAVAQRAEETNRLRDEFLATVSHELRTPLNAILGWAAVLRGQELNASTAKGLDVIERNARAQVKLVEDILDMSRVVVGQLRIDMAPCDLILIAREAIDAVRPAAAAKKVRVEFSPKAETIGFVGDAERLQQVIWNLVSNAVKFTDVGGHVSVSLTSTGSAVAIIVKDDGRGIEPEFLPYVFERFRQGDASTTRRFGGLGLGLTLVRHIVELHGGRVRVDSEGRGLGATFAVDLPVTALPIASVEVVQTPSTETTVKRGPLAGVRVLVVEDEADTRELFEEVLTSAGAEVLPADSVRAALEAFRAFRPHVLVSDIGMPTEDGYSLVRRIRALSASEGGAIPSLAVTAYTRTEDRAKALTAGFTTHLGKPVNPNDLVSAVQNLSMLSDVKRG